MPFVMGVRLPMYTLCVDQKLLLQPSVSLLKTSGHSSFVVSLADTFESAFSYS